MKELQLLLDRIEETGIDRVLFFERKRNERFKNALRMANPEFNNDIIEFVALRESVAFVIKHRFIWFLRWNYDAERIEYFHYQIWRFINTGKILNTLRYGAEFINYNPKTPDTLIEVTRGSSKTSFFQNGWALWDYYKDPTHKFLLVGGNEEKVSGSLKSIRKDITRIYLNLVAPDKFATGKAEYIARGGKITRREIDLENNMIADMSDDDSIAIDNRKEATFTIASPRIDRTSWHFDKAFIDDLVIEETSNSPEAVIKANTYRQNLMGLAHDARTWEEHYTGTEWYEGSSYHYIREEMTSIVLPARYVDETGQIVYISKFVGPKELAEAERRMKEDMAPQYLMQGKKWTKNSLDLQFSRDRHVMEVDPDELEILKNRMIIMQVGDPAYSKKNKRAGDGKSRAAILHLLLDYNNVYLYDAWTSLGEDNDSWIAINLREAQQKNIDFFIQDAQGTQGGLFDSLLKRLKMVRPNIRYHKHTTSPLTNTSDKIEVANGVLRNYFLLDEIKVLRVKGDKQQNDNIDKVILQLERVDIGMDFVDNLVYAIADCNRNIELPIALGNRRGSYNPNRGRKIDSIFAGNTFRVGA